MVWSRKIPLCLIKLGRFIKALASIVYVLFLIALLCVVALVTKSNVWPEPSDVDDV